MGGDGRDPMEHLIRGLVGGHEHLYMSSSSFHANVNALAQMLPLWIDGMATQAEENDRKQALLIELMKSQPMMTREQMMAVLRGEGSTG